MKAEKTQQRAAGTNKTNSKTIELVLNNSCKINSPDALIQRQRG